MIGYDIDIISKVTKRVVSPIGVAMQHFGNLRDGRAVNGNIKRCNNATLPIVPAIICGLTKTCHRVAIANELDNARVLTQMTNALTINVGNGFAISAE